MKLHTRSHVRSIQKERKKREREREAILIHPLRTVVNISTPSDVVITLDRGEKMA